MGRGPWRTLRRSRIQGCWPASSGGWVRAGVGGANLLTFNPVVSANRAHRPGALGPSRPGELPYRSGRWRGCPSQACSPGRERGFGGDEAAHPPGAAPPAIWWLFQELQGPAPGEAQLFPGSLPSSRTCSGSPLLQCHSLSQGGHIHSSLPGPLSLRSATCFALCPDLGPTQHLAPPHFPSPPRPARPPHMFLHFINESLKLREVT